MNVIARFSAFSTWTCRGIQNPLPTRKKLSLSQSHCEKLARGREFLPNSLLFGHVPRKNSSVECEPPARIMHTEMRDVLIVVVFSRLSKGPEGGDG